MVLCVRIFLEHEWSLRLILTMLLQLMGRRSQANTSQQMDRLHHPARWIGAQRHLFPAPSTTSDRQLLPHPTAELHRNHVCPSLPLPQSKPKPETNPILLSNKVQTQMLTTTSPFHISNTTSSVPYNCTINPYMNPWNIHASGDCATTLPLTLPVTNASPACQHAKTVTLTFPVQVRTDYGDNIYISGSIPELGNWDLSRAVPLNANSYTSAPNGDIWTGGDVKVAAGTTFQWKVVQKNADGTWLWECGENWFSTVDKYTCGQQTIGNNPTWMRCGNH